MLRAIVSELQMALALRSNSVYFQNFLALAIWLVLTVSIEVRRVLVCHFLEDLLRGLTRAFEDKDEGDDYCGEERHFAEDRMFRRSQRARPTCLKGCLSHASARLWRERGK